MEEEILLENLIIFVVPKAGVVKLVDTLDLGSSASRHGGSSPFTRTIRKPRRCSWLFCFMGPEIIIAFFMFLGLLFWGMIKAVWWVLKRISNLVFIPWMYVTNMIRQKFWGLPERKNQKHLF